jgi:hypothetical protein
MPRVAIIEHMYCIYIIRPYHDQEECDTKAAVHESQSLVFVVYVILVIPQSNNGL